MAGEQYKGRFALLISCFLGIFCSYLLNGLIVEKVARGNAFQFYTSIVMVTTIVNAIVAKLLIIVRKKENEMKAVEEKNKRAISKTMVLLVTCSLSYVLAMMSANAALKYINYPTQIIGKSGKPVMILIMSIILIRRTYTLQKCASIVLVVIGVSTFMLENSKMKQQKGAKEKDEDLLGVILVLTSLVFDGIVAVTQEKIRESKTFNASHMMYGINKWAAVIMFCIATVQGELLPFFTYCMSTDWFLLQLLALCATGVVGQQFIFLTVVNFGPLVCSVITTTRKFFTILLSTLIFQHALTLKHWACVLTVFFGLAIDVW